MESKKRGGVRAGAGRPAGTTKLQRKQRQLRAFDDEWVIINECAKKIKSSKGVERENIVNDVYSKIEDRDNMYKLLKCTERLIEDIRKVLIVISKKNNSEKALYILEKNLERFKESKHAFEKYIREFSFDDNK